MLPLYRRVVPPQFAQGNVGLWYDKFCDTWDAQWSLSERDGKNPKHCWIKKCIRDAGTGQSGQSAESVSRMLRLTHARGGVFGVFETEGRFVTGLGRTHPVENGFAWHPTHGGPYLPGSSVKGMVRTWARSVAAPPVPEVDLERLLGRAKDPRSAGRVIFLDAIPIRPAQLEIDVMTPHYAGWAPEAPPGDWMGPVPVPFLVVARGSAFVFSILPRGIEPAELDTVFGWLRDALRWAGAGAKTAVGYGRFAYDEKLTQGRRQELEKERQAHAEAARKAALSATPEGRLRLELETKREGELLDLVRKRLEDAEKHAPADRRELRTFARAVAEMEYMIRWRKGGTVDRSIKTGPDKIKQRARFIDGVAAEKEDLGSDEEG